MPRADLLSLSADDLAALSNRGVVKRSQKEVESGEFTVELSETDGDVTARWSDGVECQLPAGKVLADGRCSCAATGLCRHLIRTVLAYQRQFGSGTRETPASRGRQPPDSDPRSENPGADAPGSPASPWDPGSITDEQLAQLYRPAALARLRAQMEQGVLAELVRGSKPSARFHVPPCLIYFQVPGDPRYTVCDCAEPAPCRHVPLAVWAFRLLPAERSAGVIAAGASPAPVAPDLLDALEALLLDLAEHGLAGLAATWKDLLTRLEARCRANGLVWPAEVLLDLQEQQQRYAGHDARFSPERLADLVGELLIRCDAIRADTGAIPQLLIRGTAEDQPSPLSQATLVGLGCTAHVYRGGVELTACLQDAATGGLLVLSRDFPDPPPESSEPARPFSELARASNLRGHSFLSVGLSKLQLAGGKRTIKGELQLPQLLRQVNVQPHPLNWESLRAPVLVEDWAELDARLSTLPPSSLRPRRLGEDFHVIRVMRADGAHFDSSTQTIQALLRDSQERVALLQFPFTARGEPGAEVLLSLLQQKGEDVRFVSGPVRRGPGGLVIELVALVFSEGNRRVGIQPWIENRPEETAAATALAKPVRVSDPLADFWQRLQTSVGEMLVLGLERADAVAARRWRELQKQGEAVGLARVAGRIRPLAETLAQKAHVLRWEARAAGRMLLAAAALTRFSQDLAG